MNKKNPLISVIIPCYNTEKFVEQAVRSIMEQSYRNLEIIVINDCSKDHTGEILKKLAQEDSRIVYIENEVNLKLPKTLNKGIGLAKGEYIARMDADDISLINRIEKQIRFMLIHNDIDLIGSNMQKIDENNNLKSCRSYNPLSLQKINKQMAWKCVLVHPSILAKKSFFVELNGYNEELSYAEDYDLWIRAILAKKKIANMPDILLKYRIHNNQMSDVRYNPKNAAVIRKFLFKYFLRTKNIYFLFGCLLNTRFFYNLIKNTSNVRQKLKNLN